MDNATTGSDSEQSLSIADVRAWTNQEITDLAKAMELRIKELNAIAVDYASSAISPSGAEERLWKYQQRWGEPLPGVNALKDTTDEQILAAIDDARAPGFLSTKQRRTESVKTRQSNTR